MTNKPTPKLNQRLAWLAKENTRTALDAEAGGVDWLCAIVSFKTWQFGRPNSGAVAQTHNGQ